MVQIYQSPDSAWPPRATLKHIMDQIPSFTHKGRSVPPPGCKAVSLAGDKQGQRGQGSGAGWEGVAQELVHVQRL